MPRRAQLVQEDQRALAVLAEIGRALARAGEPRSALERALELLEEALGIVRGEVFLLHEDSGVLQVDAAMGITAEGLAARYRPGEGVIGRVLQSGRPVVVPASAREPLLLNRGSQRRRAGAPEVSVLCVPIAFDRQPAGVLVVDVPFRAGRDFQFEMQFLGVVASMIAQALKVQRVIEDERSGWWTRTRTSAGAAGALRLLEHRRHQRADAAGVRADRAGGADQHDGADPRRVGHRQGADRARDPLQLAARARSRSSR